MAKAIEPASIPASENPSHALTRRTLIGAIATVPAAALPVPSMVYQPPAVEQYAAGLYAKLSELPDTLRYGIIDELNYLGRAEIWEKSSASFKEVSLPPRRVMPGNLG